MHQHSCTLCMFPRSHAPKPRTPCTHARQQAPGLTGTCRPWPSLTHCLPVHACVQWTTFVRLENIKESACGGGGTSGGDDNDDMHRRWMKESFWPLSQVRLVGFRFRTGGRE